MFRFFPYYSAQYVEAECDLNRVRKKQRDYASSCSSVKHYLYLEGRGLNPDKA